MTYYDPSSRVPLLIRGPGVPQDKKIFNITSLFDLFPTMLDMAGVPKPSDIDAHSLMPFLQTSSNLQDQQQQEDAYPDYALSQFHGDDIHLSWFMLRRLQYKVSSFKMFDRL